MFVNVTLCHFMADRTGLYTMMVSLRQMLLDCGGLWAACCLVAYYA